jgi:hypothetical protein
LLIVFAATCPAGPRVTVVPLTIVPPADWTSEFEPHHDALVLGALDLDVRLEVVACAIRPFQVSAGLSTLSLRYQSSCVLEFAGAA